MVRDVSEQGIGGSSLRGGNLIFDLQTKRPEFVNYAPSMKPHENRFLNINFNS